jgi:succinate-acetate transporter protein
MSETRVPSSQAEMRDTEVAVSPPAAATDIAIGDPGPLGLAGFAMTTFVLSIFNTNILSSKYEATVFGLALFYGGGAQLLAGMWEFRKGNTFGALAFSSFGAFWLAFWFYAARIAPTLPTADAHKATGIFLLAWAIFTAYMTIASLRTTGAVAAVFVALTVTFVLLCIGAFADSTGWTKAGGWAGLVTAAVAWYASFAGVTNSTFKRTVLPTWPLSSVAMSSRR